MSLNWGGPRAGKKLEGPGGAIIRRMLVRLVLLGGVGLVVLAATGALVAVRVRDGEPGPGAIPEQSQEPPATGVTRQVKPDEGFLGVLVSQSAVDVASRLEGRLERVSAQVGDEVKQGSVLAVVEAGSLRRELAMAEAELLSAQAERQAAALALEEAQQKQERLETPGLLASGALSEEELAAARYARRQAAVKLEGVSARAQIGQSRVAKLEQEVAEAQIRAPFDALVASRLADAGALVKPGQVLFHLLRQGPQRVRFAVPERQVRQVAVGRPVRVEAEEQALALTGRVSHVAPEVDAAARMVFALADLDDPPAAAPVTAGAVVRVHLAGEAAPPPPQAVAP